MYDCPVQFALFTGKLTGKERDSESGLDNFGARYYGSSLGRFMTPDWAAKPTAVPYAHYGNPQSLNLYSYVQNNPTTVGDPDGHCAEDFCRSEQSGEYDQAQGNLYRPCTADFSRNPCNRLERFGVPDGI